MQARTPLPRQRSRLVGRVFVIAGLLLLILFFAELAAGLLQERHLTQTFQRQAAAEPPPAVAVDPAPKAILGPVDGVDFAIRVPKIGYFAAVGEGTDSGALAAGPGHYSDTAWPGQIGNVGVAAHNTYWIKFGDLKAGDEVDLETRYGTYRYHVTGTRIVNPDDRNVLARSSDHRLTLTTCWPLWAGAFAQQRLVIFAQQYDPVPPALPLQQ